MCGINGFNFRNKTLIKKMNGKIKYRGPNGKGEYVDEYISLGHVRLSILDLSRAGSQPMLYSNKGRKCVIVFNGEIYNYIELRKELKRKGYKFRSETDTEVIMASYLEWGYDCVKKFEGMWAFAIYDINQKIIFCSRDRIGKKPFYYYLKNGVFIFSSEIKAILEHKKLNINTEENINLNAVDLFFSIDCIPSPYTIFNNVYKLEPSTNLVFNLKEKKVKKYKYYDVPPQNVINDKNYLKSTFLKELINSTKIRLRSDVPIGIFLSGGMDSSSLAYLVKKVINIDNLESFSIGVEGPSDETKKIRIISDFLKLKNNYAIFKRKEIKRYIYNFLEFMDEPLADYASFMFMKLCKITKNKATVILSGSGGDEIFGGYNILQTAILIEIGKKVIPKTIAKILYKITFGKAKKFFELIVRDKGEFFRINEVKDNFFNRWSYKKMKYCLKKTNNNLVEAIRLYGLLYKDVPDNYCNKDDRVSMFYGLEVRTPLLTHNLIELSQKTPTKFKVNLKNKKIIMKAIFNMLPKEILFAKKQGFAPNSNEWGLEDYNIKKDITIINRISPKWVKFLQERSNDPRVKLKIMIFSEWYKRWVR